MYRRRRILTGFQLIKVGDVHRHLTTPTQFLILDILSTELVFCHNVWVKRQKVRVNRNLGKAQLPDFISRLLVN